MQFLCFFELRLCFIYLSHFQEQPALVGKNPGRTRFCVWTFLIWDRATLRWIFLRQFQVILRRAMIWVNLQHPLQSHFGLGPLSHFDKSPSVVDQPVRCVL